MAKPDLRYGVALPHLRAWRRYRVLSQAELARRSRVSRNTISAAEAGASIRIPNAARLARVLRVSREMLARVAPPAGPADQEGHQDV